MQFIESMDVGKIELHFAINLVYFSPGLHFTIKYMFKNLILLEERDVYLEADIC